MSASIITNRSALQALRAVNEAARTLGATQNRVSTGLRVAGPKDDGAVFAIAQGMRAEIIGWGAAAQSLSRARSALDVAGAALEGINNDLIRVRELASAYADQSLSAGSRALIRADIEALVRQVDDQAKLASFDGLNFLSGIGIEATVYSRAQYSLPASPDTPQSFLTPMSAGAAAAVSRSMTTQTNYSVPYSSLTPDAFAQVSGLREVAGGTSRGLDRTIVSAGQTLLLDRSSDHLWSSYATAGRVDFWVDAFTDPNGLEVWQDGVRVAATGQPYTPGGGATGPAVPVAGQTMLSFDYDPSAGRAFEIRSTGGGVWAFEDARESDPASAPSGAPADHSVFVQSWTSTSLPGVNLRPETSGSAPSSQGVRSVALDGGANAGRVDLLFDAYENADVVEIYQNGVRVAATGQPSAPGGAGVGPGAPVTGQTVLSFDYDPSNGQALEFRFNENNAHAEAGWVVAGLELYASGSPATAASFPTSTVQVVNTSTFRQTAGSLGPDPEDLNPETEATGNAARNFTLAGGDKAGRVDLWVDAYDDADVVEVWRNGVRLAASGQSYAPGGGAVAPGVPVAGDVFLSFDYDPALGDSLEFRFNEGIDAPGAWTVAGLVLQDASAPEPSDLAPTVWNQTGEVFPDLSFIRSHDGEPLLVASRNMTAAGLRLTGIDWSDPADLLARVEQAVDRAIEAAAHFGTRARLVETLLDQNRKLRDTLDSGVGNLVDADLAREAARLQAQEVRQQLAVQTLGIANAEPDWMLSLFRS